MITLRKLQLKDVPLMLEWMHDEEAKHIFQNNFAEIDDVAAKKFVENSFREDQQHFAIVDDQDDEYLGTISLKNIDLKNVKTLIGSNDPLDWTKIKQIEMYFVFCLDETEIYDSKSAYIPVEISKTPAPVETEKPKTTETVKKETKATTKNTQSKAVKTGDNTNITLYTSLLIISVIVVAGTIVLRKKKS